MSKIEFTRIIDAASPQFAKCWEIYELSFPQSERREREAQICALADDAYHFNAILQDGEVVGLLAFWLFTMAGAPYIFAEHLATSPEVRGGGIGAQSVAHLKSFRHTILLEIEPPVDEMTKRREDFYLRQDFIINPHNHHQPPYRAGEEELPLVLLSYPRTITTAEYVEFMTQLRRVTSLC